VVGNDENYTTPFGLTDVAVNANPALADMDGDLNTNNAANPLFYRTTERNN
jgi:hypothetical protein